MRTRGQYLLKNWSGGKEAFGGKEGGPNYEGQGTDNCDKHNSQQALMPKTGREEKKRYKHPPSWLRATLPGANQSL